LLYVELVYECVYTWTASLSILVMYTNMKICCVLLLEYVLLGVLYFRYFLKAMYILYPYWGRIINGTL